MDNFKTNSYMSFQFSKVPPKKEEKEFHKLNVPDYADSKTENLSF